MESTDAENDLSNPLFEKDLFGDPEADNGIGGDSLMDDLSFGGDSGLDPPFQEQLENFLEKTGIEETINPPMAEVTGDDSNASTITEEPMVTDEKSATSDKVEIAVEETIKEESDEPDGSESKKETEEKADEKDEEPAPEAMETNESENVASENKSENEDKVEKVEVEEEDKEIADVKEEVEEKEKEKIDEKMKVKEEPKDTEENKVSKTDGSKPEDKDESIPEEKGESKPEEKDKTKPEEKDETKPEEKDETKPEEKDETKSKEKEETKPAVKEETKSKEKDETKPVEKDENQRKEEEKQRKEEEKQRKEEEKQRKENEAKLKKEKEAMKKAEKHARELALHWKGVNKNPADFTAWSYLLHYVETEGNLESAKKAFNEFFSRYPYCYGYWKKFADLEKKNGNMDKAKEIFEQGLRAIPLSVELWIHYINFTMQSTKDEEDRVDTIRKLFEKAIEAAGTDFKSDKLWDMYIKFEKDQKDPRKLTHIYDRLIRIPTQLYSHHYEKFKKHLNSQPVKEVLLDEEYEKLRSEFLDEIEAELDASMKEDEAAADIPGGDVAPPGLDDGPPGISDDPPGVSAPPGEQPKSTGGSAIKQMKNEADQIKEKALASRVAIHQETEQEVSKRWAFEEAIKRPYFHVKPLEKPQLKNWIEYLDFEIAEGMLERVVILFERCLIACALYEDLWLKYAKFMEPHSVDAVRSVYTRACTIHLPNKLNIVSHWAAFEETQGNHDKTREILMDLEKRHPKSTLVTLRQINFERRIKCHDKAVELFNKALEKCGSNKKEFNFFSCKLARYHFKILGEFDKAKEILNTALEKDPDYPGLYLQLLDLEFQRCPPNEQNVMDLFQKVQKSGLNSEIKFLFSQRRLEFLMDFGEDVNQLLKVIGENQKMWKSQQLAQKKRQASEAAAAAEEAAAGPPEKKAKTETKASGDGSTKSTGSESSVQSTPPKHSSSQQYQQSHAPGSRPPPPQHMMSHGPYNQQQGYNYGGWNQYSQQQPNYNYQQWGGYNQGYY